MMKILLQVCLTTLNVMCWLVPMKIRRFVESKRAISMANAFSGGVFLSLAFGKNKVRNGLMGQKGILPMIRLL